MGKVLLQLIGAFFGTLGFCILLNIPKKLWVYSSLVGTAAWGVYLAAGHFTDAVATANFLAALTAAVISQILARCFQWYRARECMRLLTVRSREIRHW